MFIHRILIRRVSGGAQQATITPPVLPEGFDPENPARNASPGPSELHPDHGHGHSHGEVQLSPELEAHRQELIRRRQEALEKMRREGANP